VYGSFGSRDLVHLFANFVNRLRRFSEGKTGVKGLNLFHQVIYQFTGQYRWVAGDIIDWFFGVDLRQLAAGLAEAVNQMATEL